MESLNQSLFLMINAPSEPSPVVLLVALAAAKLIIGMIPLHIILVCVAGSRSERFVALAATLALLIALATNQLIGHFAYTPRPFLLGIGNTFMDHRPSASFPSNHGTVFFTYAATFLVFGIWWKALAVSCLGLIVAWSRIYVGVHFPFDMLGAAAVGITGAITARWIMNGYGMSLFSRLDGLLMRVRYKGE